MCGITGIVYQDHERLVSQPLLDSMCQTLVSRGPDDDGFYLNGNAGLAMRRLSVIDLATGKQPIHNEDQTIWVVYNGETYNFSGLRRDLEAAGHRFYTQTDTEVIVHLYEEHGLNLARYLNGMFAIALWDENQHRLVLVRDRLGIKPLFYAHLPDCLLFGSEIKAILAGGFQPSVDLQALSYYLSLLYIPAPFTIYREIRKLEAGHVLTWQEGQVDILQYWDPGWIQPRQIRQGQAADLKEELRDLLVDAVRCRLISDVPLGAFLSGGLDSSSIVASIRQAYTGPIQTFTIGFNEPSFDERADARAVAQRFGTEHNELVVTPDVVDLVPKLIHWFDEPFADSSAIPTYYLSQFTRQRVTVALGGDGGDEIFAGYVTYQADKLANLYNRLPGPLVRDFVPRLVDRLPVSDGKVSFDLKARRFVEHVAAEPGRRHYAWKAFFSDALKQELLLPDVLAALDGDLDGYPAYRQHYEAVPHLDELSRCQYADCKVFLPDDDLVKVDRMSMAHSLEVRVPLLDYRVVEFMFQVPGNVRMPGLRLKDLLKRTMRETLPGEILHKPKRGFNVPMSRWLKTSLRPLIDTYLAPDVIHRQGYFCPEVVTRLSQDHLLGKADYSRNLWALLLFSVWAERCLPGTSHQTGVCSRLT